MLGRAAREDKGLTSAIRPTGEDERKNSTNPLRAAAMTGTAGRRTHPGIARARGFG